MNNLVRHLTRIMAFVFTALPPRGYEVASILVSSTGINLLTARIAPPVFDRISGAGVCMVISGTLLFFVAGRTTDLYEIARLRAREAPYQDKSVAALAFAALNSRYDSISLAAKDAVLLAAIIGFVLCAGVLFVA